MGRPSPAVFFPLNSLPTIRLGIVGTGFIASGFHALAAARKDLRVAAVLTRRPLNEVRGPQAEALTRSIDELVEKSDLVVECSGSVRHAAEVVAAAQAAGRPVVTMNSEFHVTVGSFFVSKGLLTEAEGDQPGSIAALAEEAIAMGFEPKILGNTKGFLNLAPTREEMEYWAGRQGISLEQVTAFTDGTKVQIEQAFVANGLGGTIARQGLAGPRAGTLAEAIETLEPLASAHPCCIADYVLTPQWPGSVFVSATHPSADPAALRYLKMGEGPLYTLVKPYHLCFLEMAKTLRRAFDERRELLHNSAAPRVSVLAIAKKDLRAGAAIAKGIGSFDLRGEAALIAENPDHVPIGLLEDAILRQPVEAGQVLTWKDVDVPDSLALRAWQSIRSQVLAGA